MGSLAEALLLVALDDESGKIRCGDNIGFGLSGAVLMDLLTAGCVTIEDGKVAAAECSEPGDEVLREALELVRESGKRRSTKDWVRRLPGKLHLRDRVAEQAGLELERKLFRKRYTRTGGDDPTERVRALLLGEAEPSEREALLLTLVGAVGLAKPLVPRDRRKEAERRAKEAADHDAVGGAVKGAIREVQAATAAAAAAAAAGAAAGSS
jgi:hypothetical protein